MYVIHKQNICEFFGDIPFISKQVTRTLYFYWHDDNSNPFYGKGGIYPINNLLLQMLIYSERWSGDVKPDDQAFHFLAGIKAILPEISKKALPVALPTTDNTRCTQYWNI